MILTVTANTALDRVLVVDRFVAGARLKVREEAECIGGKGNLVSAFSADFGVPSVSLGFAAGENGRRLAQLLRARGVRPDFISVAGETRRITVVVDLKRHAQTWLMPQTLRVTSTHLRRLERTFLRWLPKSAWLALCGSLPPGCPAGYFARLVRLAHAQGVPVLIDCASPALTEAVAERPEVVKVNREELASYSPELLTGAARIRRALRQLVASGVRLAICTLGAEGAIAVSSETAWRLVPPPVQARSSAGAGDAFTAALLVWKARGADWPLALRWASAAGTAKALEARTDRLARSTARSLLRRIQGEEL